MGKLVLVVDDNSLVREGLHYMLTHAGMKVVEASTSCHATQVIAAELREGQFH